MKNLILLFILLALSNLGQAQEDSSSAGRWSFEMLVSPNVSYRLLTTSGGEEWPNIRFQQHAARRPSTSRLGGRWALCRIAARRLPGLASSFVILENLFYAALR